jgi:2-(1,2-epoxy-1,2-dihydrophenyl)acetyl-CoA isomerase
MDAVLLNITEGVATITLNQPANRNAFTPEVRAAMARIVPQVLGDPEVRSVVLSGSGGVFCAGGDIRAMKERLGQFNVKDVRARMGELYAWVRALIETDKPVIAAVDGPAFGAGFSLVLAADVVVATQRARFCLSFMRIGLVPDCGAFYTLPRVVGVQRAKELMLSARELDVNEAQRLGVVMDIVADEAALLAAAQTYARSFSNASSLAAGLIKQRVGSALQTDLETALLNETNDQALCFADPYNGEAVQRFLNKEPTLYQWPRVG